VCVCVSHRLICIRSPTHRFLDSIGCGSGRSVDAMDAMDDVLYRKEKRMRHSDLYIYIFFLNKEREREGGNKESDAIV